jgi:hypothetical protein
LANVLRTPRSATTGVAEGTGSGEIIVWRVSVGIVSIVNNNVFTMLGNFTWKNNDKSCDWSQINNEYQYKNNGP